MEKEIQERGFDFSIRIAELVQFLRADKLGFPLCDRLLNCGVQAGLVCRMPVSDSEGDSLRAKQAADLVAEAEYIIEMAQVAGYLREEQCVYIRQDCEKLAASLLDV